MGDVWHTLATATAQLPNLRQGLMYHFAFQQRFATLMCLSVFAFAPPLLAAKPSATAPVAAYPNVDANWPFVPQAPASAKPALAPGGVGLQLEAKQGFVRVSAVVPGGPAARGKIAVGDRFIAVDQWQVPLSAQVSEVSEHIRGDAGTAVEIEVNRPGSAAGSMRMRLTRAPMERLFPPQSRDIIRLRHGLTLLAQDDDSSMGVRFLASPQGAPWQYEYSIALGELALGSAQLQQGIAAVDGEKGGAVPIGTWRLDLAPTADKSGLFIQNSSLPLFEVTQGDWRKIAPPYPLLVKPKPAQSKRPLRWKGTSTLQLQFMEEQKPLADRRVTLRMSDDNKVTLDTATVNTDANGLAQLAVPLGRYRIIALQPSAAGKAQDAYFSYELHSDALELPIDVSRTVAPVVVRLRSKARSKAQAEESWLKDEQVGKTIPKLEVARWFHQEIPQPKSMKGHITLVYIWATWCGPCKMTAPMVAEIYARLRNSGLLVVDASIDRDELALEDYAAEALPGGPPIALVGVDALDTLGISSVPTFILLNSSGTIVGMHRGTGWTVEGLELLLRRLLADEASKSAAKSPKDGNSSR